MLPTPEHLYGYTKKQILQICRERKIHPKKFWSAFGVNTVALDDKLGTIYYPVDVKKALYELGHKDGEYSDWD
jgi:hypothetical protein